MKPTNERKKKQFHNNRAAAILFIGLLLIFCVTNLTTKDKSYSEKENRMLEQRPEVSLTSIENGRFMEQYESYMTDQFAARDVWVSLKTNVELLTGKRESNGIFKGKHRYLMEDISTPDAEQLQANLTAIQQFQERNENIPVFMMLVPNAANTLSDYLPTLAVTQSQSAQFKQIQETLGESVTWVDAQGALKEHSDEDIYYHTDHHWTSLGAYYAYQQLAQTMGLDTSRSPEIQPYAVTSTFNGTLSASSGYESGYREPIYIYSAENTADNVGVVVNYVEEQRKTSTLYDTEKLSEKDKYAMFLGGNYGTVSIRTTADTTDRLLLIKDSYANCLVPFLTPYYREIIMVDPRYYYGDIDQLMSDNKITSVLYLYNGNTFMEDNSISGVLADDESETE